MSFKREMPLANAVFWTARKGNVTLLRLLLNSGRMDADCKDSLGTTALMVASYCNNKDCVRELILQGADINLQRESGSTALYFAAQQGNDTIVKFLLEYGASTELATKDGATPLSIASQYGHIKVVDILLNRRCNVNIQLKDGATSLFLAAQGGHLNVVKMLLASGAKIDQPRQEHPSFNYGITPTELLMGRRLCTRLSLIFPDFTQDETTGTQCQTKIPPSERNGLIQKSGVRIMEVAPHVQDA
ncbi:ankyrin repeat domain-containing protein 29 isoform X4 [Chiloscyllium plagiosum]|uniref:ankyrin repeat domain-containing protein 29 isoform X4 n=1 Tax=Chiloscyllium plagiosum TaxID=36176 RepID=UPI001CB8780C|nr:ankyrin repeat domain-containing protein 29 isoform X4 [Chiloscyllium plagiosum]